jgi:GH24 family phage-related lysozyme (muramidase)
MDSLNAGGSLTTTEPTADLVQNQQLEEHECVRTSVYTDTKNHPSIGVGFYLDRSDARSALEAVGADYDKIRANQDQLNQSQVNQLLDADIQTATTTARNFYSGYDQLDPTRQRVQTDMAFNMGGNTLGQFKNFQDALQQGDYDSAAQHMLDSQWAKQVGNRATSLAEQMRTGQ